MNCGSNKCTKHMQHHIDVQSNISKTVSSIWRGITATRQQVSVFSIEYCKLCTK